MGVARDRFVKGLARGLLSIFFRQVEVRGAENVPTDRPVIFVGNHPNSLIDPFLVLGHLPRSPRFLAKSTLWQNPIMKPFLQLGSVIPVYRAQDGGDMSQNQRTFARCYEELARGECIALFPEGISYHEPSLQPMKTGAARIALGASLEHGAAGLAIVPFGLHYEDKGTFRSRALVQVGRPIAIEPGDRDARGGSPEAVRALTAEIERAIRALTINHASFEEMALIDRAARLWARREGGMPGRPDLAEHFPLRQAMGAAHDELKAKSPEALERITQGVREYDAALDRAGLRDDQVSADYAASEVVRYALARLPLLPLWLPIAAVGAAINWLPYRAPKLVAGWLSTDDAMTATIKLFTGFLLLPVWWLTLAVLFARSLGAQAGLALLLVAPATGWLAVRFVEKSESFVDEVRAYAIVRLARRRVARLRALRRSLQSEIDDLARDAAIEELDPEGMVDGR